MQSVVDNIMFTYLRPPGHPGHQSLRFGHQSLASADERDVVVVPIRTTSYNEWPFLSLFTFTKDVRVVRRVNYYLFVEIFSNLPEHPSAKEKDFGFYAFSF